MEAYATDEASNQFKDGLPEEIPGSARARAPTLFLSPRAPHARPWPPLVGANVRRRARGPSVPVQVVLDRVRDA